MALRVRASDIEDRSLPPVCVVTGGPAEWNWNVRYVNPAGALVLLLFFGVVPYLLARFLTRHEVAGQLPVSTDGIALVRERRRKRLLALLVALLVGVAGIAGATADERGRFDRAARPAIATCDRHRA